MLFIMENMLFKIKSTIGDALTLLQLLSVYGCILRQKGVAKKFAWGEKKGKGSCQLWKNEKREGRGI